MGITMRAAMVDYMQQKPDFVATLKELYEVVKNTVPSQGKTVECSCRALIYRHEETFKKVAKGVYMLSGEKSASLIIHGDSRNLSEIEDNSIDCIITDHPWSDKKAHRSGNQKGFAEYDTFTYQQSDFNTKARVMKEGAYLVEFLPVESGTNWEYLSKVKEMAKESGFSYYASCIWRKAPEGSINTGRTTKGVEQVLIWTKGKARRLSPVGKPYMTKEMLNYEVEIPIRASEKNHQAEKPLELYKYLLERLTEEGDIALDQFGGAMNLAKACVDTGRFGIVYEICKDFVDKAVKRFGAFSLFTEDEPKVLEKPKEVVAGYLSSFEFTPEADGQFSFL